MSAGQSVCRHGDTSPLTCKRCLADDMLVELDTTLRALEKQSDSNMITVNRKTLIAYIKMAKNYCILKSKGD